jgi:hypothetical protein
MWEERGKISKVAYVQVVPNNITDVIKVPTKKYILTEVFMAFL